MIIPATTSTTTANLAQDAAHTHIHKRTQRTHRRRRQHGENTQRKTKRRLLLLPLLLLYCCCFGRCCFVWRLKIAPRCALVSFIHTHREGHPYVLPPTHAHAPSRLNKKVAAIVQNGRTPTKKKLQIENVKNKTQTQHDTAYAQSPCPPSRPPCHNPSLNRFKWLRPKSQLTELNSNRDTIKLSFFKLVQF